ncbi:NAD(P)H-dependent glycerol-3-phosphate dehydrogenase [Paratractidigestivibacter sp.]|uniref:NAD(P)H-dependent glycerol-3-phosphate dehydrogenase n=1 Tax=Paratractidigestivibacter sp. TaxID=2847316 RepID=UPI003AB2FCD9
MTVLEACRGSISKACVVGSGSWGTAFTGILAPNVGEVVLWCRSAQVAEEINLKRRNPRRLCSYELCDNVSATADAAVALDGAGVVVLAVPSAHLRAVCRAIAPHVACDAIIVVLTKGMELDTHKLMHEIATDELGDASRIAVVSGPNHAEEISCGQVSAAVVASSNTSVAERVQGLLFSYSFRSYVSSDVVGVEVCGAVKNVVAIACGLAAGLGAGDNTLAVLMTRGIAEVARISSALGGDPLTPMGLAGMGDLVATCTSEHSRNRTFGEALAHGETLAEYEARTNMVVEGARAAMSVHELAVERGIEAPITAAVHGVLVNELDIDSAKESLLGRLPREEFYGMTVKTGKE